MPPIDKKLVNLDGLFDLFGAGSLSTDGLEVEDELVDLVVGLFGGGSFFGGCQTSPISSR